jgi:hypothetical protein
MGDADSAIAPMYVRTARLDGGTGKRKFLSRLTLHSDTIPAAAFAHIRYSDDDYLTWSPWRPIDLSKEWKQLNRLGSFRSRAFELRYDAGYSDVNFQLLELAVEPGSR